MELLSAKMDLAAKCLAPSWTFGDKVVNACFVGLVELYACVVALRHWKNEDWRKLLFLLKDSSEDNFSLGWREFHPVSMPLIFQVEALFRAIFPEAICVRRSEMHHGRHSSVWYYG